MELTIADYIDHLQSLVDTAEPGERKDQKQEVVNTVKRIFNAVNGSPVFAVYFALPIMVQSVLSVLHSLQEIDADEQGPESEEERQFLKGIREQLDHAITDIDCLTGDHQVVKRMTKDEIHRMFDEMPDKDGQ